jgi:hypothetical protein
MNTLKRIKNFFRKPRRYATLNLPHWVNERGVFPGILKGGVVRAEIIEETDKALQVRYSREYVPLWFGLNTQVQQYCVWMLKTDHKIVEVYEL